MAKIIVVLLILFGGLFIAYQQTIRPISAISDKTQQSPYYKNKKFYNPDLGPSGRTPLKVAQMLLTEKFKNWPTDVTNQATSQLKIKSENNPVVTFINHASFLIQINNKNILIDPIFSNNAGPFTFTGPERIRKPGLSIEQLPNIDIILISHNHYDSMDLPSLRQLQKKFQPKIIVPVGDKNWLTKMGINNITEVDWWDKIKLSPQVKITFTPAQHSSARGLFDRDQSFWGGYVIQSPMFTLYHAGDTGYNKKHFQSIGNKFTIDIALLPIGSYQPRWFMQQVHMNPAESVQAFIDLNAKQAIAMHYKTFQLSSLYYLQAEKDLLTALQQTGLEPGLFILPKVGQSFRY